jgi:hypothetical protein
MTDLKVAPTKAFTEEEAEQIRRNILAVGDAARKLLNSGLSKRAIAVLIHDATNLPLRDIRNVLDAAADLPKLYLLNPTTKEKS